MLHYKLMLPEHMNSNDVLFGGNLLKWIDEVAYITARLDFPGNGFVTVGLDKVVFKKPVKPASILAFDVVLKRKGRTSVEYCVDVFYAEEASLDADKRDLLFETNITFVNIGPDGCSSEISGCSDKENE